MAVQYGEEISTDGHICLCDLRGTFGQVAAPGVAAKQYHMGLDRSELLADSLVPLFGDPGLVSTALEGLQTVDTQYQYSIGN